MARLILVRHGETDWNREGRWQGQADVPLNARGFEQAARLAQTLTQQYRIDAIYSSDLLRARQTAEALAAETGLPVFTDVRLREVDQGEWEGLRIETIQEQYQEAFDRRQADPWGVAPPGGETAAQVRQRVEAGLAEIAARHASQTVVVVTHGFVLAVARTIHAGETVERVWELVPEHTTPVLVEWRTPSDRAGGGSG